MPTHDPELPTIGGPLLAGNGLSVPIGSPPLPPTLAATSWLVADIDSGEVLGACGAHRYAVPASVQKLLLLATVLPKLNPADVITVIAEDFNFEPGSSAVGLVNGGTYTIEDLYLGLILNSGNDTAQTLARLGGGSRGVAGTLADMNAEARRLGAWDTHAETPSGLDGPGQVTSAYDMALIFRACFAHENFRRYLMTRTARMPPQPPRLPEGFAIQSDNQLLLQYPGALGGKTGYTNLARHTFVGAAERNGRRLVATVLGAEIRPQRAWQQTATLLDWGFALAKDASVGHLVAPGEAEKLTEPTPSPSPAVTVVEAQAPPTDEAPSGVLMVLVGAGAVAIGGAWFAFRLTRHRRTGHRRWRADRAEPTVPISLAAVATSTARDDTSTTAVATSTTAVDAPVSGVLPSPGAPPGPPAAVAPGGDSSTEITAVLPAIVEPAIADPPAQTSPATPPVMGQPPS
jgi:D-alanyl-D-alanine carboxypeptidase (penicillin-binding protein 5/6)